VCPRERLDHIQAANLCREDLPRVTHILTCKERTCASCGEETAVIGYDESEQLDVEPARYFVRVTKREKRVCRLCSTVTAAPLADRIVEKGSASDAMVINTIVAKLLRPSAVVPSSGDDRARSGSRDRTRDTGWLGDACGRVAGAYRGRDAARPAQRILFTGR
jgi:transposase